MATSFEIAPPGDVPLEEIIALMKAQLPGKNYHQDVTQTGQGNSRRAFKVSWGPGSEARAILVDRKPDSSPHAIRNFTRGLNTEHEVNALAQLDDAEEHFIIGLKDYGYLIRDNGQRVPYIAKRFVQGPTLEQFFEQNKRGLNFEEHKHTFRRLLVAAKHMKREGWLHRDYTANNIMLERGIDAFVIDNANAREIEHRSKSVLPTFGGRKVSDPIMHSRFVDVPHINPESHEMYALGALALRSAINAYAFEFDPDAGTGVYLPTGESVLRADGKIDKEKYIARLDDALSKLPRKLNYLKPILRKSMSLDVRDRFTSLENLATVHHAASETWREKVGRNANGYLSVAGGALALIGSLTSALAYHAGKQSATVSAPPSAFVVGGEAGSFDKTNQMFQLTAQSTEYFAARDERNTLLPVLAVGERSSLKYSLVSIRADFPTDSTLPFYPVRVYVQGDTVASEELYAPRSPIEVTSEGPHAGGMHGWLTYGVKRKGMHTVMVDVLPPNRSDSQWGIMQFDYSKTGGLVAQTRVPVVVGDVPRNQMVTVQRVRGGYTPDIYVGYPAVDSTVQLDTSLVFELNAPEHPLGALHQRVKPDYPSRSGWWLQFHGEREYGEASNSFVQPFILQVVTRDKHDCIVGVDHIPMERFAQKYGHAKTRKGLADSTFMHKAYQMSEKVYRSEKNGC